MSLKVPRFGGRLQEVVSYWVELQGAELSLTLSRSGFVFRFLRPGSDYLLQRVH